MKKGQLVRIMKPDDPSAWLFIGTLESRHEPVCEVLVLSGEDRDHVRRFPCTDLHLVGGGIKIGERVEVIGADDAVAFAGILRKVRNDVCEIESEGRSVNAPLQALRAARA